MSAVVERSNNFDALRLIAASSVIFSHAFLLSEGRQDNEPLMLVTGGQSVLGVVGVFVIQSRPVAISLSVTSVNVPPTSRAIAYVTGRCGACR